MRLRDAEFRCEVETVIRGNLSRHFVGRNNFVRRNNFVARWRREDESQTCLFLETRLVLVASGSARSYPIAVIVDSPHLVGSSRSHLELRAKVIPITDLAATTRAKHRVISAEIGVFQSCSADSIPDLFAPRNIGIIRHASNGILSDAIERWRLDQSRNGLIKMAYLLDIWWNSGTYCSLSSVSELLPAHCCCCCYVRLS